jgi:hypothetical protein
MPAPAPAPAPSGGQEWGCIATFQPILPSSLSRLFHDDLRVHTVRRTADVFHPPRTSFCPI